MRHCELKQHANLWNIWTRSVAVTGHWISDKMALETRESETSRGTEASLRTHRHPGVKQQGEVRHGSETTNLLNPSSNSCTVTASRQSWTQQWTDDNVAPLESLPISPLYSQVMLLILLANEEWNCAMSVPSPCMIPEGDDYWLKEGSYRCFVGISKTLN